MIERPLRPEDMPKALRIEWLDVAASDADHIAHLVDVLYEAEGEQIAGPVASSLWVIRDLAEILAWNLRRLAGQQRTGR